MNNKKTILISGATATGKSAFAIKLAKEISGEIINADVGSFYKSMTIGTAKPDWRNEEIVHHMFDIIEEQESHSTYLYRNMLKKLLNEIWKRGKIPIIVGGSVFYIQSFFYKQQESVGTEKFVTELEESNNTDEELWGELNKVDHERASLLPPGDRYRVIRALAIFRATGEKASSFQQSYAPLSKFELIVCSMDRKKLYKRIDDRVWRMIDDGLVAEVANLEKIGWREFLIKKKMIGYDDILFFLSGDINLDKAIVNIQMKSRRYAKRQITFLRKLYSNIERHILIHREDGSVRSIDLTLPEVRL